MDKIKWSSIRDRFIEGIYGDYKFFINLSKDNKTVVSLYVIKEGFKDKWIPNGEDEANLDFTKMVAEEFIKNQ